MADVVRKTADQQDQVSCALRSVIASDNATPTTNTLGDEMPIQGHDPLHTHVSDGTIDAGVLEDATKREVLNVLKSYTGYYDIFSELLQNALDAVDERKRRDLSNWKPQIWLYIDIKRRSVRVVDNGIGMPEDRLLYCFRPNISFKNRQESRGHKGVGATFLAYGYSVIKVQTKHEGKTLAAAMRNGRQWAEGGAGGYERPRLEETPFSVPELEGAPSGTSVEIVIAEGQRPSLMWLGATTAKQWAPILRAKTPLGGIYIDNRESATKVDVKLTVTDANGNTSTWESFAPEYLYPHELETLARVQSISDVQKKFAQLKGDAREQMRLLDDEFKRLDALYEIWGPNEILAEDAPLSRNLDEGQRELIQRHNVHVYGCFVSTAKTWTQYRDEILGVHKNSTPLRGGLQLASDTMIQGDLLVIPLTSSIGYQNNTHIVVHFRDGNPDMGRKAFQPELKAVAEEISRRVVDIFRKYISLLREDQGNPIQTGSKELFDWKIRQMSWRDNSPFEFKRDELRVALVSSPQSEQDVIALYHELVGMGVIRGLEFLSTSQHERYDGLFITNYSDRTMAWSGTNVLGVQSSLIGQGESQPLALEYKVDFDGLVADFSKDKKYHKDIDLAICWTVGDAYKEDYTIAPYLVGQAGSDRTYFGSTHKLVHGGSAILEIVCLHDLIAYLRDSKAEDARQRAVYVR